MILFYDTETTGLVDWKAEASSTRQPNLVQLGALLMNWGGRVLAQVNLIVEPDGWEIPEEASRIHKITTKIATESGVPRRIVLATFNHLCKHVDATVAHNHDFDHLVMMAQYHRENVPHRTAGLHRICTMKSATQYVKIPKAGGLDHGKQRAANDLYKWPSLTETHQFYCGKPVEGAHDAMIDCTALANIFWAMNREKHLPEFPRRKAATA